MSFFYVFHSNQINFTNKIERQLVLDAKNERLKRNLMTTIKINGQKIVSQTDDQESAAPTHCGVACA